MKLGPYEIVAAIGEGGMGQVYSARDTRLGRSVAIKILPTSMSSDQDRLRRFEQEARAAGALNHPNVLVVHDVGNHEQSPYVVCELLEGGTLRDQLRHGPLPARKVVDYAIQIGRGLAAAHERGIVHRDLKPENLFVTSDGHVKILDFGIAKLVEPHAVEGSDTPTEHHATHPGLVLGTAGYMSPEQVRGQRVDHRSDIFSFGAVLYEMLSGKRAFSGDSPIETLNAILTREPPEPPATGTVPALQRVWQHCLEKRPEHRFQSARDIAFALEGMTDQSGSTPAIPGAGIARSRGARIAWLTACAFMLTTAALSFFALQREPLPLRPIRFEVPAPDDGTFQGILGISSAVSPDGRSLALVVTTRAGTRLYVRSLDSTAARRIDGTEGASSPFWSPDSQWIAFFADGMLRKVRLTGGAPQPIGRISGLVGGNPWETGAWGVGDTILVRSDTGLYSVTANGGEPVLVPSRQDQATLPGAWPNFLPDGRTYLFMKVGIGGPGEIRVGSLDSPETQLVLQADSRAIYSSSGHLLFVREGTLMAQKFDPASKQVSGDAEAVAEDLLYFRSLGQADFSVSTDGVLAYQSGPSASRLAWLDRDGVEVGQVGTPAHFFFPRLSADGQKVAVDILDRRLGTTDIYYYDLSRGGEQSRLTLDPAADWTPVFSPDGSQVAFASARAGAPHVHVKNLSESGDARQIVAPSKVVQFVSDWVGTPDGGFLIYQDESRTRADLMRVSMAGDRKPTPLVPTAADDTSGVASPDGRLLAYVSNDSGRNEVYLRPMNGSTRRPVSTGGGVSPRWREDGKELFFVATTAIVTVGGTAREARLMAVSIGADGSAGVPVPLFAVRARGGQYDTRDGKRFLVNLEGASPPLPITVDLGWTRRLRQ